jgi:hypothetical protein
MSPQEGSHRHALLHGAELNVPVPGQRYPAPVGYDGCLWDASVEEGGGPARRMVCVVNDELLN